MCVKLKLCEKPMLLLSLGNYHLWCVDLAHLQKESDILNEIDPAFKCQSLIVNRKKARIASN